SHIRVLFAAAPVTAQHDWPTPIGPMYPAQNRTWIADPFLTARTTPANVPVGDTITDVPRGALYPIDARTGAVNLRQSTLAPPPSPPPTAQYDWPTPKGAVYPADLRTFVHPLDLWLYGKDQFFGGPGQPPQPRDWVLPRT